jgi:hypothetical protein
MRSFVEANDEMGGYRDRGEMDDCFSEYPLGRSGGRRWSM